MDSLMQRYPYEQKDVQEIYDLIVETVVGKGGSMTIFGQQYPRELVKSRFLKLNMSHIEYVMECLRKNTTKVYNIKAYLLAALFNAGTTMSNYYRAEVNHDMPQFAGQEDLYKISKNVTNAAQEIIRAKNATYYGIGMALVRIVRAIFGDEKSALTVSVFLNGQYGVNGIYAGLPAIIGRNGVKDVIVLDLKENERTAFLSSCKFLEECATSLKH